MRAALSTLALLVVGLATSVALAQRSDFAVQPQATLQLQAATLDGVWRVGGLGDLTLTTRANEVLQGRLAGRNCHGQHRANAFSILCPADGRGPYLISGIAVADPPVASTARGVGILRQSAHLTGQIHQSYLTAQGHTEQIAQLSATRL